MKTKPFVPGGASVLASRICHRPDGSRGRSPHQSLILFASLLRLTRHSVAMAVCILALIPSALNAATNDLSFTLQRGLFEEEANRNLEAAAQAYQTVSAQFDKDRQLAATAIFRLGEIYRKQGKTNEAASQYERIVREFADQDTLVTLSRQNLTGLGASRESKAGVPASRGDRSEQRRLLAEEIKLVEEQADVARRKYAAGVDGRDAVITKEREILDLKRQLAALADSAPESTSANVSQTTDQEEKEIRRIQKLIKDSPDLINGTPSSQSPLCFAALNGYVRLAAFLLDNGADVNKVSVNESPLQVAVRSGQKTMVELLLQRGADVSAKDDTGGTALHLAAQNGFLSIAEVLLKYKANLHARNSKSNGEQSPLHLAAKNGNATLVGFLLANGDDPNRRDAGGQTPLHVAAAQGRNGVLEQLLKSGAEINAADATGKTPLMDAALVGHSDSVKALLAANANPDLLDNQGRTALSYAAEKGPVDSVQALLAATADPNLGQQDLPLAAAVKAGQLDIAETLLRGGANPNLAGKFSREVSAPGIGQPGTRYGNFGPYLPLQIAVADGNAAMIKLLLKYKADASATDPWTKPPRSLLFYALAPKDIDLLKAFLEAGANPNVVDGEGQSPLMKAASPQSNEIAALLVAAGAEIKIADRVGRTALVLAVAYENKHLTALLLSKGADPNQRMNNGQTPLDLAKSAAANPNVSNPKLSEEIAALLRQHGALEDLPDFTRIRITRQGIAQPETVFVSGPKLTNQFTLLETVMNYYARAPVFSQSAKAIIPANQALPFPDLGRIIIHRPDPTKVGQEQQIKVSLLNASNVVDCAKDVPVQFGDVIEIPERVHALNETTDDPVRELGRVLTDANRPTVPMRALREAEGAEDAVLMRLMQRREDEAAREVAPREANAQRLACLQKSVQLVVAGETNSLKIVTWQDGFLAAALARTEARAVLRSSSDLSRVKVTRKEAKTGRPVVLTVDVSNNPPRNEDLWLQDGDVIEVPDKP